MQPKKLTIHLSPETLSRKNQVLAIFDTYIDLSM